MKIVHTYRSGDNGLFVNSYLVESEEGVVIVDAPLLLSDGRACRARLDALKKPVRAVLITHPHPDHYNTITQLIAGSGDIPVVALRDVDRILREQNDAKRNQWSPVFGAEWPDSVTFPNTIVPADKVYEAAGLHFIPHDLGPGESASGTVWILQQEEDGESVAFIGDLVFNGTHAYVSDGMIQSWIDALSRAGALLDGIDTMYPGHGSPGRPTLLQAQKQYLLFLIEAVANRTDSTGGLSPEAKAEVARLMEQFLPGAPLLWLIEAGLDAVASEGR